MLHSAAKALFVVPRSPSPLFSPRHPSRCTGGSANSGLRFLQSRADPRQQGNPRTMDDAKTPNQNPKEGDERDVMSNSFGEGYSTRSDEEGFGGIYGGNQTLRKPGEPVKENHTSEYDKSQGSEVKETEKGRHQRDADA